MTFFNFFNMGNNYFKNWSEVFYGNDPNGDDVAQSPLVMQIKELPDQTKVAVLDAQSMNYILTKIVNAVQQSVSKQLSNFIYNKDSKYDTILKYLDVLYNGVVSEDHRYRLDDIQQKQQQITQELRLLSSNNMENRQMLQDIKDQKDHTIQELTAIIQKQHESIVRYENDVLLKTQKDLIMELIGIADQIHYTLDDQKRHQDYQHLLEDVTSLGEWVEGSLENVAVRKIVEKDSDGMTLDKKRQEVVEIEETSVKCLDGALKPLLPGYVWSLPVVGSVETQVTEPRPRKIEFVLRPEQMARLRYVAKEVQNNRVPEENSCNPTMEESGAKLHQVIHEDTPYVGGMMSQEEPHNTIMDFITDDLSDNHISPTEDNPSDTIVEGESHST